MFALLLAQWERWLLGLFYFSVFSRIQKSGGREVGGVLSKDTLDGSHFLIRAADFSRSNYTCEVCSD